MKDWITMMIDGITRRHFHQFLTAGTAAAIFESAPCAAAPAQERTKSSVIVSGERIQRVGFRATVQNLAIRYNLAGFVRNKYDGTVEVRLEGAKERVRAVIDAMRRGSKKSSKDNEVRQIPAEPMTDLDSFTIYGWTSVSRDITNPYDLVFRLRSDDRIVSRKTARRVWNSIAMGTLKGEDQTKFEARLNNDR